MATNIVQMTDGSGNKQYPVTSAEAVGMPDGSGNLQNYLNKRVTELNISVLYPTQGIGGTNKYDLATAIAQVPAEYRNIQGLKVSFVNEDNDTETWEFKGGSWVVGSFSEVGAKKITEIEKSIFNYPYEENIGGIKFSTGEVDSNKTTYRYIDLDVSSISKIRIKGKNTDAALGYTFLRGDGIVLKDISATYNSSTFSDIDIDIPDEAARLLFCYNKSGVTDKQKIVILKYKVGDIEKFIFNIADDTFALNSINNTIPNSFINYNTEQIETLPSYSIKYFEVKKGDRIKLENYVKGNHPESPISFVSVDGQILQYTNKNNVINSDNSSTYVEAPEDCLCYISKYATENGECIVHHIRNKVVEFVKALQEENDYSFDYLKRLNLTRLNLSFTRGKYINQNGQLLVPVNSHYYYSTEEFYPVKKGGMLLVKKAVSRVPLNIVSFYTNSNEGDYKEALLQRGYDTEYIADTYINIKEDGYIRVSSSYEDGDSFSLELYGLQPTMQLLDEISDIKEAFDEYKRLELTYKIQETNQNYSIKYPCNKDCKINIQGLQFANNIIYFYEKENGQSILSQNLLIGDNVVIPPENALYFNIYNVYDKDNIKISIELPLSLFYENINTESNNQSIEDIVISGDSVASNLQSKFLSSLINNELGVIQAAAGSEGPWSTMMRMGWVTCMILPGFTIPASNEYGVAVNHLCGMFYKPVIDEKTGLSTFEITDDMTKVGFFVSGAEINELDRPVITYGGFDCYINGVLGRLGTISGYYIDDDGNLVADPETGRLTTVFQRYTNGEEVIVDKPTIAIPSLASTYNKSYHINFMGQNRGFQDVDDNLYYATPPFSIGEKTANAAFQMQKINFNAAKGNMIIIGCLFKGYGSNGTIISTAPNFRQDYERLCEKEFGAKFVNLRQYMITQAHIACGRTLSQSDIEMIKIGELPPYLGDVHLNELGAEIAANLVAERCYELGWIKNKPNYYDVVATRIRLEGDGTITD